MQSAIKPEDLVVYDPKGKVSPLLRSLGIPLTAQKRFAPPAAAGKTWLIGPDALEPANSHFARLRLLRAGRRPGAAA